MYRYDEFDAAFVSARVGQFRDQVGRRLAGELTEDQFRPHRLMNGLYLQLHSYMLRIAVPYGTLSARQMRKLAEIARKYDRGYGHFTTRQNLQFNWPALKDTPDILAELASVEMHAIQTSGNCIRNVTADHFAGVAADELADPRPYAEILRQWSSLHPEFSFLPRKFKIAVNGSPHDRAVIQAHDIGLQIVRDDAGELGFAVYVGGGLGRTPFVGRKVRDFLPQRDLLAYCEAILRVYNLEGRRDNKYKARIKILLHEKGLEGLRDAVEAEFSARGGATLELPPEEVERIAAYFAPPPLAPRAAASERVERRRGKDAQFAKFFEVERRAAQGSRLRHRHRVAEADRRRAGRRQRRPDGRGRRPRRGLFARRTARLARAEPHPALCRARRPVRRLRPARVRRPGDAQRRADQRHHRLPRPRLLRAGDRALDSRRPAPSRALRRRRARARDRAAEDQDFRLHQRLRPSSRRPHRHSRPRARRRRDLPDHARRLGRRDRVDRPDHRPRLQFGDRGRRGRDDRRHLSWRAAAGRPKPSSTPIAALARRRSRTRSTTATREPTSDERARRQVVRRRDRRQSPRRPLRQGQGAFAAAAGDRGPVPRPHRAGVELRRRLGRAAAHGGAGRPDDAGRVRRHRPAFRGDARATATNSSPASG